MPNPPKSPCGFWSRIKPALSLTAIAAFVLTALYAKWNPALGDEELPPPNSSFVAQVQKKDPNAPKAKKKQPELGKSTVKGPVLVTGNGKKLDFHELAKIIDVQVAKRMA